MSEEEVISDIYMGRMRVLDADRFKSFWAAMKAAGGVHTGTSVGDPPTAVIRLDGKIVAQWFAPFMHDPEHYYVDPEKWSAWLEK